MNLKNFFSNLLHVPYSLLQLHSAFPSNRPNVDTFQLYWSPIFTALLSRSLQYLLVLLQILLFYVRHKFSMGFKSKDCSGHSIPFCWCVLDRYHVGRPTPAAFRRKHMVTLFHQGLLHIPMHRWWF